MKPTYYVRSTGEVVGPNMTGKKHGEANKKRLAYGNLFTSKARAERAAKIIKFVLRVVG